MSTPSQPIEFPFWTLLGRTHEIATLISAFNEVAETNSPKVLTILGDSGRGKTRLLAELYAMLSKERGNRYWPETLEQHPSRMMLNPRLQDFNWPQENPGIPDFYWWGIRLSEPDRRNYNSLRTQIYAATETLLPHLAFADHANLIREDMKSAFDFCIDCVMEIGISTLSLVTGVGLIKPLLMKTYEFNQRRQARKKIEMARSNPLTAERNRLDSITSQLLGGIEALVNRVTREGDDKKKKIPFVLCLDDAHWLDSQTANFISSLIERARANDWPILVLITAWPSEWALVKSETDDPELRHFHQTIDTTEDNQLINLLPLSQLDQLIEMALPDLPVSQRLLLSKKSGPDLYGLYMLIEDIKDHPKFFTKSNSRGSLKSTGVDHIQRLGPLREDLARSRLRKLVRSQQTILSILACLGQSFIRKLGLDVLEVLQREGWIDLADINLNESFDEIVRLHQYIFEVSPNVFAFSDEVKLKVTRDLVVDDPVDVDKVQLTLLIAVNQWLELGLFSRLSQKEMVVFFDNAIWALTDNQQLKKHKSNLFDMVAGRLQVLNEIFSNSEIFSANTVQSNFSSAYVLDIASFRSGLPIWWQAKWLQTKAHNILRTKYDLQTYDDLISATTRVLDDTVFRLKSASDFSVAEAACISASTLASLTWSCINQSIFVTSVNKAPEINERKILTRSLSVLRDARTQLMPTEGLARSVSITLLGEAAEIARGIDPEERDELWQQMGDDLDRLIRSSSWNEQHAQLLFDRVFNVCFFEWTNTYTVKHIVTAILEVSKIAELKQLGNYQLVILGMAYQAQVNLNLSNARLLDESLDCCFELIRREFGALVWQNCWSGGMRVAISLQDSDFKATALTERQALAWAISSNILKRLFEEEAVIPPRVLFEMSKLTLIPYAKLFFPPWTDCPGNLSEFIRQIHLISPNSGYQLLTSASYAWYIAAKRHVNNAGNFNDANWVSHELEAIKAISLVPRSMIHVTRDYDRLLKLTQPFFDKLERSDESEPIGRWLGSCVVATLDCMDIYTTEDFKEIIFAQLFNVILGRSSVAQPNIDIKEDEILNFARQLINSFVPSDVTISKEVLDNLSEFRRLVQN
jgi:hypothetical protein